MCLGIDRIRKCHAPLMDTVRRGSRHHPLCRSARLPLRRRLTGRTATLGVPYRRVYSKVLTCHNHFQVHPDLIQPPTWICPICLGRGWTSLSLQRMSLQLGIRMESKTELSELLRHHHGKLSPTASCGIPRPLSLNQGPWAIPPRLLLDLPHLHH